METGGFVRVTNGRPAVGWRVWTVQERCDGVRLGSVIYDAVWTPGASAHASCRHDELHVVPDMTCNCGFHAARDPVDAFPYLHGRDEPSTLCRVLGTLSGMRFRFCDEFDGGFGWIVDEFMERCSHALVADGRVWLIDPLDGDGVEDRNRAAGDAAGVIQLLDRHNRDCAILAARLGVPHHVVPRVAIAPFQFIPIRMGRFWKEVALWWRERRVLVFADVLGTPDYLLAGRERLGVHPLLRLRPPRKQLGAIHPVAILCGHGAGLFDEAGAALREALSTSRRRIPGQAASAVRAWRASRAG